MGQVADILESDEWKQKSPLEKAAGRRDLFELTVNQNPQLQQALASAQDPAQKQEIFNAWDKDVRSKFPKAFSVSGRSFTQSDRVKGLVDMEFVEMPIGDLNTEAILEAANPATESGRKFAKSLFDKEGEAPDVARAFRSAMFQRYGTSGEEGGKIPDNIITTLKSGRPTGRVEVGVTGKTKDGKEIIGYIPDSSDPQNHPVLIPNAIRTVGTLLGSAGAGFIGLPTGPGAILTSSLGGAGGAAIVEPLAQYAEKRLGVRDKGSFGEGVLNVAMGGIPIIPVKGGGMLLRGAVRAAEGAVQGGAYSAANQLILDEAPFSWKQVGIGTAVGFGLGGLLGGMEGKLAARFAGKTPEAVREEIPELLKTATPEQAKQLTELQRQIEESIRPTTSLAPDAPSSARTFEQAMDTPAPPARDTELAAQLSAETPVSPQTTTPNELELQNRSTAPEGAAQPNVEAAASGQEVPRSQPEMAALGSEGQAPVQSGLKPLPEGSIVEPLGKRALALEGVGEPVEQWQVKLPGEERGRTLTAEQLAAEGFSAPEAAPNTSEVRAKYPDVLANAPEGQTPVEIRRPDGTTYPAVINGYYETPKGDFVSVGRMTDGGWSHGMLREGEQIVSEVPTAKQWGEGVRDVAELRQPGVKQIYNSAGFLDPTLLRALSKTGGGIIGGAAGFGYGMTKGDTLEDRIKNGLTYGILGAGGGYMAGKQMIRAADQLIKPKVRPEIAKWRKRLSAPDGPSIMEAVRSIPNRIREEGTTSFAPADKLPRQIARANNTPLIVPELPLSRSLELVNGASGKAWIAGEEYADMMRAVKPREWEDFNVLLAVKRTGQRLQADINDAQELAHVMTMFKGKSEIQARAEEINNNISRVRNRLRQAPGDPEFTQELQSLQASKKETDHWLDLIDNPNRRRVPDETPQRVDAALNELRARFGDKRFDELDQLAAGPMQQQFDKAMRIQVATGRMSEETYAGIKASNDFYAPYKVMQAADDFDGFGDMRVNPIDTMRKYTQATTGIDDPGFRIDDPATAGLEKIMQSVMLGEKNLKMLELANWADQDASGTVIKKLGHSEDAPRGMQVVNYHENGIPSRLAVQPDLAKAVKGMNPAATGVIARFVSKANAPFRMGVTGASIRFQAVNFPADIFRQATMSKYGIGRGGVVETLRYPLDFVHALYSSVLSRNSTATATGAATGFVAGLQVGDDPGERFRNAMAGGVLGAVAGSAGRAGVMAGIDALGQSASPRLQSLGEKLDPTTLYRDFYNSGAAGSTLSDLVAAMTNERGRMRMPKLSKAAGVIDTVQDFGRALEETTKMLGFKRGVRIEGLDKLPPQQAYEKLQQVVSETRNFAGSPDFPVAGNLVRDLNPALVFLNPRVQGMVEDGGRLLGRDGPKAAAQAWTALASTVGLGAAAIWYQNHRPENGEDLNKISPDERKRYAHILRYDASGKPLYMTNERGEKVRETFRSPLRDTAQNFYQMVQSSMDFANTKDPEAVSRFGMDLMENLSPINIQGDNYKERGESVISSFGPVGTVPYMLLTDRIPGLHRDIFRDKKQAASDPSAQFEITTPQTYRDFAKVMPQWIASPLRSPMMLEQLTSAATGGAFSQFTPPKPLPGRDETALALQSSPLTSRFVRSTYNYNPAPPEAQQALKDQNTQDTLAGTRGRELYANLLQTPMEQRRAMFNALPAADKQALAKEAERVSSRPSTQEIGIISRLGVENGARAKYILQQIMAKPLEARRPYFEALRKEGYLTPNVLRQINYLIEAQQQGAQSGRN